MNSKVIAKVTTLAVEQILIFSPISAARNSWGLKGGYFIIIYIYTFFLEGGRDFGLTLRSLAKRGSQ